MSESKPAATHFVLSRISTLLRSVAFWICVIALLTLSPVSGPPLRPRLCLICGDRGAADVIANIVLYLPLGLSLGLRSHRRIRYFIPFVLSLAIELAQHFIPGRNASLADVLFNSLGGALGIWLGAHATTWWNQSPRVTRAWFMLSTACALAIMFLTAFLVTPAPTNAVYFALWTPDLQQFERYDGRVLSATIGTESLPAGMLPNAQRVRDAIAHDYELRVSGIAAAPAHRLAPVLSVTDQWSRQMFLLGIDGPDLVYHYRNRANDWYLDLIELRVPGLAASLHAGGPLELRVQPDARGVHFEVNGRRQLVRAPHLGMGWRLLGGSHPLPYWLKAVLDYVWLMVLMVPVGYWAPNGRAAALPAALMLVVLLVLPMWTWLAPTPILGYTAVTGAVFVGRVIRGRCPPPAI